MKRIKFSKYNILIFCYLLVLGVLLPHTAWMFSFFEPTNDIFLRWFSAIAFEITIGFTTHMIAVRISKTRNIESLGERTIKQFHSVEGYFFIALTVASIVANWIHGFTYGYHNVTSAPESAIIPTFLKSDDPTIMVAILSIIFGAILPLCNVAYAYILSAHMEEKSQESENNDGLEISIEELAIVAAMRYIKDNGQVPTPDELSASASIPLPIAIRAIAQTQKMLNG